jgi:hypothetical protein
MRRRDLIVVFAGAVAAGPLTSRLVGAQSVSPVPHVGVLHEGVSTRKCSKCTTSWTKHERAARWYVRCTLGLSRPGRSRPEAVARPGRRDRQPLPQFRHCPTPAPRSHMSSASRFGRAARTASFSAQTLPAKVGKMAQLSHIHSLPLRRKDDEESLGGVGSWDLRFCGVAIIRA